MNPSSLAILVKGLKDVVDEHGFERTRLDSVWLYNILADYSPQTSALNRVVATVAREGFTDLLRRARTAVESDAVVREAVSRLMSAYAFEQGAAYDAVMVWVTVLGVVYTSQSPSSLVSASSVGGVGDRLERKIQRLLDEAEAAEGRDDWAVAVRRYDEALMLEPAHIEALQLRVLAERRREECESSKFAPPADWLKNVALRIKPAAVKSVGPMWRTSAMADCGEDSFGRWAVVMIGGVEAKFRYCVPGRFLMGSSEAEPGRFDDEGPVHEVEFTNGFWMAEAPVTQRLWQAVLGSNPSQFKGADRPVERVSWSDCDGWLSRTNWLTSGLNFRFPTEAEWEYAARAGTIGPLYGELDEVAWYVDNSGKQTHPVKQKTANPWGLFDMVGNVCEWCSDWYGEYSKGYALDPKGPSNGFDRLSRGGSWSSDIRFIRSAFRYRLAPGHRNCYLGFRLVFSGD